MPDERAGEARVVLVTAPDDARAREMARDLVARRLAACVNLVPSVTSVYRWQEGVEEDQEVLMVVKTTAGRLAELSRWLATGHPYDVPEYIALTPTHVEEKYLAWLVAEASGG